MCGGVWGILAMIKLLQTNAKKNANRAKNIFSAIFLVLLSTLVFMSCSSDWSTPGPNNVFLVVNGYEYHPYRQFTHGAGYADNSFVSASGVPYLSRIQYDYNHFFILPIIFPSNDIHIFVDGPGVAVTSYLIAKITEPFDEYENFEILISNSVNLQAVSSETVNIEIPSESGEYVLILGVWYSDFGRTYSGQYQKPFSSFDYVFRLVIN